MTTTYTVSVTGPAADQAAENKETLFGWQSSGNTDDLEVEGDFFADCDAIVANENDHVPTDNIESAADAGSRTTYSAASVATTGYYADSVESLKVKHGSATGSIQPDPLADSTNPRPVLPPFITEAIGFSPLEQWSKTDESHESLHHRCVKTPTQRRKTAVRQDQPNKKARRA